MIKVVIADDEKKARQAIIRLIRWKDLKVEFSGEAEDGDVLCTLISTLNPDIALVDMKMPGISGTGLIKHLCTNHKNLKVIIVSGYSEFEYAKQAIQSNVIDYILKPVDEDSLNSALRKAIDNIYRDDFIKILTQKEKMEQVYHSSKFSKQNFNCGRESIHKLKEYVDSCYTQNITLEKLSQKFFLNKQYISRLFKKEYSISLFQYINYLRIEKAKELLLDNNLKILEIIDILGFYDEAHFSKSFKKSTGDCPSTFRRKYLKDYENHCLDDNSDLSPDHL